LVRQIVVVWEISPEGCDRLPIYAMSAADSHRRAYGGRSRPSAILSFSQRGWSECAKIDYTTLNVTAITTQEATIKGG
jgi:hypothetical protein